MQTTTKIIFAVCSIVTVETLAPANAQYYPPPGYGYGHRHRTWNGCPEGWTVQGGNCAPYKGPGGGGWNTWNGCPPGYTVWKLRTLSIWKVRQAAKLLTKR